MTPDLIEQPFFKVTPSTGVVHKVPCIRNTASNPLAWPEFRDKDDDRACSHCLPDGLPDLAEQRRDHWLLATEQKGAL